MRKTGVIIRRYGVVLLAIRLRVGSHQINKAFLVVCSTEAGLQVYNFHKPISFADFFQQGVTTLHLEISVAGVNEHHTLRFVGFT